MKNGPTFETKLERIEEFAATANMWDPLSRSLLHAYAACLTIEELCAAVVRTLDRSLTLSKAVDQAILNRLLRIGSDGRNREYLDQLGVHLLGLLPSTPKTRVRIDALLSQLYGFFLPPTRQAVLEQWRSRGTIGAGARWLRAISDDHLLFEIGEVLAYWRDTGDPRAAKLLAYRGDSTLLAEILPELIERCKEGWIVSRAAMNAGVVSEASWAAIRGKFPASYAYLCAKQRRHIGEAEALVLVRESGATWPANDRGLAIWALGQLGMWSALEQIRGMFPEFHSEIIARLRLVSQPDNSAGSGST